jgi:hypothetical protein
MLVVASALFGVGWLVAEATSRPGLRRGLGVACILTLALSMFFASWRAVLIEGRYRASFRLLGEILDKGDLDTARNALATYNEGGVDGEPVFRMFDILAASNSPND